MNGTKDYSNTKIKKRYVSPKIEVVYFADVDVITASVLGDNTANDIWNEIRNIDC